MGSEQDIISAKLEELRKELAAEELEERKAEEKRRQRRERGKPVAIAAQRSSTYGQDENMASAEAAESKAVPASPSPSRRQVKHLTMIESTHIQIALLEELMTQTKAEVRDSFRAIQSSTERSSRQGVWLTIGSSAITLVLGWLLSLLGSPATLIHAFGR